MLFVVTCLFYKRTLVVPQITANAESSVLSVTMVTLMGLLQEDQVQPVMQSQALQPLSELLGEQTFTAS